MNQQVQPPATEYQTYTSTTRWIILIAVMLGTVLEVLDTSIVNVAIPDMMGNLGATLDQISWVSTGYIVANVIVLPLTGWFSHRFGRRLYLTTSMIVFTAASLFCGLSRSLEMLVFFRILQGIGGAALLSTAQATMLEIFPPQQVGLVTAIFGLGVMVGPTVGPTLGGWITDNYSWPWIFFINLPIGIAAATLTYLFLRDSHHQQGNANKVDAVGIGLLAIGLGCMQTVLEKGNRESWFESVLIIRLTAVAVAGLISFVLWELHNPHPAVNLRILRNRSFTAGVVIQFVVGVGLYGGIFLLPVFLQELRHYTAAQTGMILLPGGLATGFTMPLMGRLVTRFHARYLAIVGLVGFSLSMIALSYLTMDTGPGDLFWPWVARGASLAFLFVPLTVATLNCLPFKDLANGAGLFNLARQLGGSAGIAFLSTHLDHLSRTNQALLAESVTVYSQATMLRLAQLQAFFMSKGSVLVVAHQQALAAMNQTLVGQATVISFGEIFRLVAVFFLLTVPLVMLLRKNQLGGRAPQMPLD